MKIYLAAGRRSHTVIVQPGNEQDAADAPSEWFGADEMPLTFTVKFEDGVATVPTNLGGYLVAKGIVSKSPIIIPDAAAIAAVEETRTHWTIGA